MPESGIGAQAILALSSFKGFVYPADIEPSVRWFEDGLDPVKIEMDPDGWIFVPAACGVGALLDHDRYKRTGRALRE